MNPAPAPASDGGAQILEFFAIAVRSNAQDREALWRRISVHADTPDQRLQIALLQTLPGHSGFDPAAAELGLKGVIGTLADSERTNIARIQLALLRTSGACHGEVSNLKEKLTKVVDIERKMTETEEAR